MPIKNFKRVKDIFNIVESFVKTKDEESDKGYFLDVADQYPQKLHNFLERMKIENVEKLVANLHDKTECYTHKKFKTSIKSWISFEKIA